VYVEGRGGWGEVSCQGGEPTLEELLLLLLVLLHEVLVLLL
jgi:hypothetical protein